MASGTACSSPLLIVTYSKVRLGITPDVNALAAVIVAIVGIGVAVAGWLMARMVRAAA
ncbi:MAG: hypothetical protein OXU70_04920 [Gammaproteobacteria bacterium]|nr:hypothetical protein [Gammaproteobacteria bacterium]